MIVCYCRKSRVSESDELDRQVRLVEKYCESKKYTIDRVFAEVGSSVDADRPEYTALLKLLNKCKNCTIVTTDLDRLSRNTVILGLFQQLCKEQGHLVELTNGTIYNYSDYTDSFTSDNIASVSAYIYKQTSAKMYRGLKQAQKEGKRVGAKLYGYNIVNKRLAVNPEQADTVKRVFKLIAEGVTTAEVVKILKQDEITTNNGRSFDTRAIRLMVQNVGYTGSKGDNVYPPIIDKELFLLANQQLKSLPNCGNKRSYPLSSKIKCSKCGNNMVIGMKKDRATAILSKGLSKTCKCMSHRYDYIESLVKSDCLAYIENKLGALYEQLQDDKAILAEHQKELEAVQSEIDTHKEKLSKLNKLFLLDNITEQELKEYSSEFKSSIALLEEKQKRLEGYSLFRVVQELQDKIVKLEELKDNDDMKELSKLVKVVMYFKDQSGITVETKFKEGI